MFSHKPVGAVETTEAAPAKINLALHVTGQRTDGYHLLDTLVTFTEAGDVIRIHDAPGDGFSISGSFADVLRQATTKENLVLKARDLLREAAGARARPVAIHLEKNLPVSSGIGGGSADAAATLRGLRRHWNIDIADAELAEIGLKLGADVPMCLARQPLIARGIGEDISTIDDMPVIPLVLANPLKGVSTPEVFKRLKSKTNPPLEHRDDNTWMPFLTKSRNDLEIPARKILPDIDDVCDLLRKAGAQLVRMSGSGATCFGIFKTIEDAKSAADQLRRQRPDWYVQATKTIGGPAR
ncbi:4-diphosphocytidyl-2-C-methyl-D-erythritol kinase [Rhizobium skierniewicense]|uniref:4-diphosphocytidyl-2-C-methyl-D-erythritol kinase n=1 Tax=Rhizobium skierniewicense TaxID=984260 RepID=A0A7W6C6P4_9HYPH|nr:4-(cytidine 5'-diphospho)-2-C-methyl-D-erythritol kinase [Rhizobium skierniewicense]MBB3944953.1 4-diphosphocytidyl-2-C-methyl-D-erythritol kinase [Rhizobium skierniewicense]